MDDLPIVLTRYGKPVALVKNYSGEEDDSPEDSPISCQYEGCNKDAEVWVRLATKTGAEAAYALCREHADLLKKKKED